MIVWWCGHGVGRSEESLAAALEPLPDGLAFMGLLLPGRDGREIDGLVVSPRGVLTIEVKGTALVGPVETPANGPWRVGGATADFAGGPNPLAQARRQAQRLREHCAGNRVAVGYVPALVVIAGAVMLPPVEIVTGVWATDLAHLADALHRAQSGTLSRRTANAVLRLLDLGGDSPIEPALDAAGFPREDGSFAAPTEWSPPPRPRPQPSQWSQPRLQPPPPDVWRAPARSGGGRSRDRRGRPYQSLPHPYDRHPPRRTRRPPPPRRPRSSLRLLVRLAVTAALVYAVVAIYALAAALNSDSGAEPTPSPTRRGLAAAGTNF